VVPNDGKCHLDSQGNYYKSKVQDYPSLGQVDALAKRYRASIIWAVTADKVRLYASASTVVEGSRAAVISEDSSNIVDIIRRQYEAITTTVAVRVNSTGGHCKTRITSECGGSRCRNVELNTAVNFTLEVTPTDCRRERLVVSPVGLKDELVIDVEPICECPCKTKDDNRVPEEERCQMGFCSGHGHLICGECSCCGSHFGPKCQCGRALQGVDPSDPDANCRPGNASSSTPLCGGRGECVCGKCECKSPRPGVIISGQYCGEVCDNTVCEVGKDGFPCSGVGACICGRCKCPEPYSGSACGCRREPERCVDPAGPPGVICSGRGECPCDRCVCEASGWYSGTYCETCDTCKTVCAQLRPCVECLAYGEPLEEGNEALITHKYASQASL